MFDSVESKECDAKAEVEFDRGIRLARRFGEDESVVVAGSECSDAGERGSSGWDASVQLNTSLTHT